MKTINFHYIYRLLKHPFILLRWSKFGQKHLPPRYPTVGAWLQGKGNTFNPETRKEKRYAKNN